MHVYYSFAELSKIPCPVHWAMGFFDGVHLGHRRVIESACTPGTLRGVLTFMPHPLVLLRPELAPALLTPHPEMKVRLMRELGVDVLLVLPFTRELAALSPQEFLGKLCTHCRVAGISVGSNWHFGKGGSGNVDFLRAQAQTHHFTAVVNDILHIDGDTVCSTRIRTLLSKGQIISANTMLGRPFTVYGRVEHGQKLARTLGFPTANITLPQNAALPLPGVYEVRAIIDGAPRTGIANIGQRPTICENFKPTRLEAHFLNWSGNLYECELNVQLLRFIRPEQKFSSINILKTQIERDIASLTSHI